MIVYAYLHAAMLKLYLQAPPQAAAEPMDNEAGEPGEGGGGDIKIKEVGPAKTRKNNRRGWPV
jgi:hypothetical protein